MLLFGLLLTAKLQWVSSTKSELLPSVSKSFGIKLCHISRLFWPDCKPEGPLFSAEFVCLSVCVCIFWPALLPFNIGRFWWNLVIRTLLWSSLAATIMVQIGRRGTARRLLEYLKNSLKITEFEFQNSGPSFSASVSCVSKKKFDLIRTDRDAVWDSDSMSPGKHVLGCDARWHNLLNTIEPSVCSGDAACCQITLTGCCYFYCCSYWLLSCCVGLCLLCLVLFSCLELQWMTTEPASGGAVVHLWWSSTFVSFPVIYLSTSAPVLVGKSCRCTLCL